MTEPRWAERQLLERYRSYLLLLVNLNPPEPLRGKVDPSDIVQLTLLHAYDKRDQFRGQTEVEFLGWLRAILATHLAQAIRRHRRPGRDCAREQSLQATLCRSDSDVASWLETGLSSPSQRAIRAEQILALADALAALPEGQRKAIQLHHFQNYSLDDTAEEMGRTPEAVAGLLYRGLQKLKQQLAPLTE